MYVAGFLEINFLSPSKGQTPKKFFAALAVRAMVVRPWHITASTDAES
jgi:hypothetical protein